MRRSSPSNDNSQNAPPRLRYAWDIYRAAAPARWVGQVVAGNASEAIETAAVEFQTDVKKLIAVRRGLTVGWAQS
jgi:hypothetical protein